MAITLKLLKCHPGLAPNSTGNTYDLSPNTTSTKGWLVKTIFFFNNGSAGQNVTVDLKVRKGGTSRALKPGFTVNSKQTVVVEDEFSIDLNSPEVLSAFMKSSSGTPSVDCVITGVERDQ